MKKELKIHVKIGDNVTVISGFHKTKNGEIIKINKRTGKVIVKGVNFKFKHIYVHNYFVFIGKCHVQNNH